LNGGKGSIFNRGDYNAVSSKRKVSIQHYSDIKLGVETGYPAYTTIVALEQELSLL